MFDLGRDCVGLLGPWRGDRGGAERAPGDHRATPHTDGLNLAAAGVTIGRQGFVAVDAAAQVDYASLPSVIFTSPQLASAGLTEAEAISGGHACIGRKLDLDDVPRALVDHDPRGMIKIVAEAATRRVLGVHALANGAGEMMLAAMYAIKAGWTVDDIANTWAPYLTMAESLRLTAATFRTDLPTSCCA